MSSVPLSGVAEKVLTSERCAFAALAVTLILAVASYSASTRASVVMRLMSPAWVSRVMPLGVIWNAPV